MNNEMNKYNSRLSNERIVAVGNVPLVPAALWAALLRASLYSSSLCCFCYIVLFNVHVLGGDVALLDAPA